jgi:hypothetical protein
MRRLAPLLAALATLAALAPAAGAAAPTPRAGPVIGLSDQGGLSTFADPLFQQLGMKQVRLITPWNSIYTAPEKLDAWIQAARAAGATPLVSFEHSSQDNCPDSPCRAPSLIAYGSAFRAFRARYPGITQISPWNEANHKTQPTWKHPELAAYYFNLVKLICPKCRIVAADVLDEPNMIRWLTKFQQFANKPKLWGLHNYSDTNRFRVSGTRNLLKTVPGQVWLTETGAVTHFVTSKGVTALPDSPVRAVKSMHFLFDKLIKIDTKRITRLYIYNWKSDDENRFDAGLINPDGTPRLIYYVVKNKLAALARRAARAGAH